MNDTTRTEKLAMRYVDGEMNPAQREAFEQRLESDESARSQIERLRKLDRRVREALAQESSLTVAESAGPARWRWVLAGAVAASVALAAAVSFSAPEGQSSPSPRTRDQALSAPASGEAARPDEVPLRSLQPTFETHAGSVLGVYDPETNRLYLFERTDQTRVQPPVELTGL
jgi:anti-sigma factor RsiW